MKLNSTNDTVMEQRAMEILLPTLTDCSLLMRKSSRKMFWMLSWQTTFWEYLSQNVVAACCLLYFHSPQVFKAISHSEIYCFVIKVKTGFSRGVAILSKFIKNVLLSHSLIICYCLNPLSHVPGISRVTVETFNLSSIHRLITSHTHTDPGTTGTQAVLHIYCVAHIVIFNRYFSFQLLPYHIKLIFGRFKAAHW